MKKLNQKFSLVLTFLFLFSLMPNFNHLVKAEEVQMPAADMMAVLTGNFVKDQGLGNDWDTKNQGTLMKEYSKGIYELTVEFKVAKSYEYKATFNGQWDNPKALGNNGENKKIDIKQPGKVIFRVDYLAGKVYDSINDAAQFKNSATITGILDKVSVNGKNWDTADSNFDIDYIGGGFYKKVFHLNAGELEYKVAFNHGWNNGEVGDNGSNVKTTVPQGGADVTFLANPILGFATDSIHNSNILSTVSLIGTVRQGQNEWDAAAKGYEFSYLDSQGKYIYNKFLPAGSYTYKAVVNYSWDESYGGEDGKKDDYGNKVLTIPEGGKHVVFVADKVNKKVIDSINNPSDVSVALGLVTPEVVVKSPVINSDGTVTFNYKDKDATSVSLRGDMNGWGQTPMTKDAKTDIWSVTLRLGDAAKSIGYKFFLNNDNDHGWIKDPLNTKVTGDNSLLELQTYSGRKVVLAGTIQSVVGEGTWVPGSDKTKLIYDGNAKYHITIPNVPAGNYEYKIAMGSWDPENYGANGKEHGDNMKLYVPSKQDVTFWYSDDSHYTANSIEYKKLDVELKGTGISEGTKLTDASLTNIYNAKVKLSKGSYSDIKAVVDGKEYSFGTINITEDSKDVTFSYAPAIQMVFSDAASQKISLSDLYFDSRSEEFKTPYGAITTDSNVTFNIKAKKDDLTVAKLVLITNKGTKIIDMSKNGSFADGADKWTVSYKFNEIGMNKYYFLVSNGSDVKAYSDDDGYFGAGTASDISNVKLYDLNVYDKNFKTPDWMKNAVIYQIFPDRFFNGDNSNDYAQKLARGSVAYENPTNWYMPPEDPTIEFKTVKDKDGNAVVVKDSNGKPVLDPNYKGFVGDGEWSNDMYGGDIKGVQAKLDYLQALGINVLYFNPVSSSISNHRYDTTDYRSLDPLLGHMDDFVNLSKEAHKRGMHVILDGVFNHVSDDSIYFDRYGKYMEKGKPIGAYQYWSKVYDLMNAQNLNQQDAEKKVTADLSAQGITDLHYKDWFVINNKIVDKDKDGNPIPKRYDYEGWWGYDSMPVIQALNGSEYQVKSWADEIIDGPDANSRYWLKQGSDGWRLDVANEVSDETWNHFRTAVKEEGDNAIIGEIWDDASKYLLGDMYDSVMNYRFRNAILYFVKGTQDDNKTTTDAVWAMNELEKMREQYPKEAFEVMMNLVDSHDTQRVISAFDGYKKDTKAVANTPKEEAYAEMKLIPLIQMTYPGAPTIYYGDEAGIPGADDPDNRRGMIWGKGNQDLVEWYAKLANIRNAYPVLRTGDIVPVTVSGDDAKDVMSYLRNDKNNHALVVVSRKAQYTNGLQLDAGSIPNGTVLTNALNPSEKYTVEAGKVTVDVPKQSGLILVASYKAVTVNTSALKDAYDQSYIVKDKVRATGVTIDKNSLEITVEASANLKAVVAPENTTLKDVIWSSSNSGIAKIDASGKVTAVSEGKADITVTTLDGGFTAKCSVTVKAAPVDNGGNTGNNGNNNNGGNSGNNNGNTGNNNNNGNNNGNTNNNSGAIVKNDASKVVEAVKNAASKSAIVVDASENKKVDKSVFEAIKGTDKSITFTAGNSVWTFNGKDINKDIKDIDLTVKVETLDNSTSPNKDAIKEKVKNEDVLILSFAENGVLPGEAKVKIKLDAAWLEGKDKNNLYVYYYNPSTKKAEIVAKKLTVDKDGYIEFEITHNSDYFVADKDLVSAGILPKTGSMIDTTTLVTAGLITTFIGVLIVAAGRRKRESEA
ncbi:Ig-like domain-containing protein [Clostridium sp. YIM B02515]|uniref:Ig-like domain-containing protein n=1 Tax=Clostridium rhizosphaerae TaxID=2803861 RepID=A0ABS1TDG5_9CLOT|nr:alpha-amylase family glycosyl hydrolase [Clostridium rhizosphaerae]MBL4937345.1 Ig-like domain-containing protein [Clostridium rhizosphaerae]